MENRFVKGGSFLITIIVIAVLIISGPVNAFILGLTIDNTEVSSGDIIKIKINAHVEEGYNLDVDRFLLDLSGPVSISCLFNVNGTLESSCNGITIKVLNISEGFGYGYGYGYGESLYEYEISLDTTNYPTGKYSTQIVSFADGDIFSSNGPDINIKSNGDVLQSCSVRAEGGTLKIGEMNFKDKGRISFYIPKKGASKGKGSLVAQNDRIRASYKFDTNGVLENTKQRARFTALGEIKIQREDPIQEDAIVTIDKIKNKISVLGDSINATNMDITFIRGCN